MLWFLELETGRRIPFPFALQEFTTYFTSLMETTFSYMENSGTLHPFPDRGFPPLQPDGFVLDRTRVKFETVLRVIVHERPVCGCDHEPSIDLRHLGVGYPGSDRIGDKIAVEG